MALFLRFLGVQNSVNKFHPMKRFSSLSLSILCHISLFNFYKTLIKLNETSLRPMLMGFKYADMILYYKERDDESFLETET